MAEPCADHPVFLQHLLNNNKLVGELVSEIRESNRTRDVLFAEIKEVRNEIFEVKTISEKNQVMVSNLKDCIDGEGPDDKESLKSRLKVLEECAWFPRWINELKNSTSKKLKTVLATMLVVTIGGLLVGAIFETSREWVRQFLMHAFNLPHIDK